MEKDFQNKAIGALKVLLFNEIVQKIVINSLKGLNSIFSFKNLTAGLKKRSFLLFVGYIFQS